MSDIKGDAAATHNKFGLDLGMDFSYILSISGFGESIGTNLIQAVSKDGKPAMVNFVANSNAIPNDITPDRGSSSRTTPNGLSGSSRLRPATPRAPRRTAPSFSTTPRATAPS